MIIDATIGKPIKLGRLGENEARTIRFPVGDTLAEHPAAEFTLLNMRETDADAYPVPPARVRVEGGFLYWTVTSGDLAVMGNGECELVARENSVIVKDDIYQTIVSRALDGSGEVPDPWQGWVDEVEDAADRAEAAASLLENCSAEAETLQPGESATAAYEDGTFTFGIPKGEKGDTGGQGPEGNGIESAQLNQDYTLTLNYTNGNHDTVGPIRGEKGETGDDGYSPSASVSKSGSKATITITDKNGTTTAEVNDGQNGQDGVTPNVTAGTTTTGAAGTDASVTRRAGSPDSAPIFDFTIPKGDKGDTGEVSEAELSAVAEAKADVIVDSVSGAIASFPDGAENRPVRSLVVGIEPVQDLHGQESPYPPGGGKNKFDISKMASRTGVTVSGSTFTGTARDFTANGFVEPMSFPVGTTLTVQCKAKSDGVQTSGAGFALVFICEDNSTLRPWYTNNNETTETFHSGSVTATSAIIGYRFLDYNYGTENTWTVKEFQIEVGSTATAYAPYSNICPISGRTGANVTRTNGKESTDPDYIGSTAEYEFPQEAGTVYGGNLTIHQDGTGTLVVDRVKRDLSDLAWIHYADGSSNWYSTGVSDMWYPESGGSRRNAESISNVFAYNDGNFTNDWQYLQYFNTSYSGYRLFVQATEFASLTTQNQLKARLNELGAYVVYRIATPVTYQLTNQQVLSVLKGTNVCFADCGSVSLEYPADTKLYIDKKFTELQALILEN